MNLFLLRRNVDDVRLVLGRLVCLIWHELVVIMAEIVNCSRLGTDACSVTFSRMKVVVALSSRPLGSDWCLALLPLVNLMEVFIVLVLRGRALLIFLLRYKLRHALLERLAAAFLTNDLHLLYWLRLAEEVLEDTALLFTDALHSTTWS